MRPLTYLLLFILILLCIAVSGCSSAPIRTPEKITVVVEKYKPLPLWATQPIEKPMPSDGTVGAALADEFRRGVIIDLLNCHRRLLAKIDRGEAVNPKECEL